MINYNYAILSGSNSHTIVWHSISSKLVDDLTEYNIPFDLYGYTGGMIFEGQYNNKLGKSTDFFAGF